MFRAMSDKVETAPTGFKRQRLTDNSVREILGLLETELRNISSLTRGKEVPY